jgi:hypothetical protein
MDRPIHFGRLGLAWPLQFLEMSVVAVSLAIGSMVSLAIISHQTFLLPLLGIPAIAVFLIYPELALAAYVVVGDVKGNESVASLLPVDLTLAMGAILLAGIALNWIRGRQPLRLPAVYYLFLVLIVMMAASLCYTPAFAAGLDKFARFLTVTAIVILAPFFVLNTPVTMKRFLIGFSTATLAICAWSLSSLGGVHRLVSPSDNTIGLGHIRAMAYPLLAVPILALIGSASRGSVIACLAVVVLSIIWQRGLLLDAAILGVIGIAALPFAGLPRSSLSYLGSLIHSQSVRSLLDFRGNLLSYGWSLLQQHPLFGAGLAGFRYLSPNPTLYKWPHNIFLEIACELGIPAALLVLAIFGTAVKEAIHQLRDRFAPHAALSQITAALLLVGMVTR